MKKKDLMIVFGSIVLITTCVFAGMASAKFNLTYIYVSTVGGACKLLIVNNPGTNTFTVGGYGFQSTISNDLGISARRLWGSSNCAAGALPVHFHG